jgi:hypothetical protein
MSGHGSASFFRQRGKDNTSKVTFKIDTADIIAACAGLVAIMFAGAMIGGLVPIQAETVAMASLAGAGAVIAPIVKATKRKARTTKPRKG